MNVMTPSWRVPPPSGVAIGVFDGVHVGHQRVIGGLAERCAEEGLHVGVLTFEPHPVEVLAPGKAPPLLTSVGRRIELFRELSVDWAGLLDLRDIRTMSPDDFISDVLIARASARIVSVGHDFRFGHARSGDVTLLTERGRALGFDVAEVDLLADDEAPISSTRIRKLVAEGDVSAAAALLGRPHRVSGEVVRGDARGRDLGYPTANISVSGAVAMPADGIYAVRVTGAVAADGVASIGVRPTFGDHGVRLLEVHLFDVTVDLYGSVIDVDFVERLRGERRFDTVDALIEQMDDDSLRARRALRG